MSADDQAPNAPVDGAALEQKARELTKVRDSLPEGPARKAIDQSIADLMALADKLDKR